MKKILLFTLIITSLSGCTNTKERKIRTLTGDMYIASNSLIRLDREPSKTNIEQAKRDIVVAYNSAVSASKIKNLTRDEAININVSKHILLNTYNNLFKIKGVK